MNIRATKQELRETSWRRLQQERVARFPGAEGRIPNFVGAEAAADLLAQLEVWRDAGSIKCNPDSPQMAARKNALAAGITVFMAVPRLREPLPFIALDPDRLDVSPHKAASIKGASRYGRSVGIDDMPEVDLVLAGSVAVSRDGARLGKGGGYSDLEFALARQAGLIGERTVVVSTVHPLQVVPDGSIPMTRHDVPLDLIVTPDEIIPTARAYERPPGILWDELDEDKLRAIPVLQRLRVARSRSRRS
jgi:5-formyltetrahydrofolate cyclo-ligase